MLGFVVLSSAPEREKKELNQPNVQVTALASLTLTVGKGIVNILLLFERHQSTEEDSDPQTFKVRSNTTHSICLLGTNMAMVCGGAQIQGFGSGMDHTMVWADGTFKAHRVQLPAGSRDVCT